MCDCRTEEEIVKQKAALFTTADLEDLRRQRQKSYLEFLRIPSMSAGLYVIEAGAKDMQRPHQEDEMYYVLRGRARFSADGQDFEVSAGSVLFVAAKADHRFHDIVEDLTVLVFFAPAET